MHPWEVARAQRGGGECLFVLSVCTEREMESREGRFGGFKKKELVAKDETKLAPLSLTLSDFPKNFFSSFFSFVSFDALGV